MDWFRLTLRRVLYLLLLLSLSGCSGIKPYAPVNHREEGPESGLFSGTEGAFVILRQGDSIATESKEKRGKKESDPQQQD